MSTRILRGWSQTKWKVAVHLRRLRHRADWRALIRRYFNVNVLLQWFLTFYYHASSWNLSFLSRPLASMIEILSQSLKTNIYNKYVISLLIEYELATWLLNVSLFSHVLVNRITNENRENLLSPSADSPPPLGNCAPTLPVKTAVLIDLVIMRLNQKGIFARLATILASETAFLTKKLNPFV